jgi:hypothetical protein
MKAGRWALVQRVGKSEVIRLVVTEAPDGTTRGDIILALGNAGLRSVATIAKPVHESKWSGEVDRYVHERPVQFVKLETLQSRGASRLTQRKLTVRVTPDLHELLQRRAEVLGMSVQELSVMALSQVVAS